MKENSEMFTLWEAKTMQEKQNAHLSNFSSPHSVEKHEIYSL